MLPDSRVLIIDTVLPALGESTMYSLLDLKMLMMGGMERTEAHWETLLGRSGLEITNILRGHRKNNDAGGVIEAKLI